MFKKNRIYLTVIPIISIVISLIFASLKNNKENFGNGSEKSGKKYTAVIVEPRKHKALPFVLENFLTNLSDEWDIIIMHGNKNEEYVDDIIENSLSSFENRISKVNLNVDNLTISDYNNMLKSKEFYEKIPTEIFLIFQTDTVICENDKDLINKFLEYDYVGAPWRNGGVGNGGLSLRRKSKMLEIISNCPTKNENEDVFFANPCVDIYKPSYEDAKEFSVEQVYNKRSFGVHKAWGENMTDANIEKKVNSCKPMKKLMELN
jgi:hypothetical protein